MVLLVLSDLRRPPSAILTKVALVRQERVNSRREVGFASSATWCGRKVLRSLWKDDGGVRVVSERRKGGVRSGGEGEAWGCVKRKKTVS